MTRLRRRLAEVFGIGQKGFSSAGNFRQLTKRFSSTVSVNAVPNPALSAENNLDWMKNLSGSDETKLVGRRGDWWWTGVKPLTPTVSALPQLVLKDVREDDVRKYFENTWLLTEVLFSGLQGEEAFYRPPYHHLRHPMIFYYGHVATLYVNKLRVAGLLDKPIDPYFENIFEVGVDEMRWDDISTQSKSWPKVSDVHAYRQECFKQVQQVISREFSNKSKLSITWDSPLWSLMMAIEHEKIHIETSSVLMRELPLRLLRKPEHFPKISALGKSKTYRPEAGKDFSKNELVGVTGDKVKLGKSSDVDKLVYGWDNEYGSREVSVPNFKVSKFKVSNGEYFEFVKAGGYRERKFWSDDGWGWRTFRNQKWPTFWTQKGPAGSHDYALRTIFEEVDMPWSWPVNVNYHEASAFINWKNPSMRLITEAEFNLLKDEEFKSPLKSEKSLRKSLEASSDQNFNLKYGSESAVDGSNPNSKGIHDLFGNVWEWAEDDFNSLPGFKVHPYYDDFSAPCFDGEHKMILGGSFMSMADNGGNLYSRYHFRPHFHQHSGFRYVLPSVPEPAIKGQHIATFLGSKSPFSANSTASTRTKDGEKESDIVKISNSYESEKLLDQYLALHYGQQKEVVDKTVKMHVGRPEHALNFPTRTADLLYRTYQANAGDKSTRILRALDVGCAVGAATFKLAEYFDEVVGLDYSFNFINKATEIRNSAESFIKFQVPIQGNVYRAEIMANIPPKSARERTEFIAADATKLDELKLGQFDAILCSNLLCRLPDPKMFLSSLKDSVRKGGVVLFISPYSWLEEFTPQSKWLLEGDKLSAEVLKDQMIFQGFKLIKEDEVPLFIREHERKYQYIISHALAFQKI